MDFVAIGKLKKPHGLKGEIKLVIEDRFWDSMTDGIEAFFVEQAGKKTPFFIEYLRGKSSSIIKLEEIDSKELAMTIANRTIYLRRKDILMTDEEMAASESDLEYAFMKNYILSDKHLGEVGSIKEIADYPQQEMAVIHYNNKEILIPLLPDWIIHIDRDNKTVILQLPEGLLEL